jgi:hypothetical protein
LHKQIGKTAEHGEHWYQMWTERGAEVERLVDIDDRLRAELDRVGSTNDLFRAALTEITDLDLEGDASLADAIAIADEALNPPPDTA